ncbi:MAG: CoA transferase [Dehalococcoidia bacterium]|nr:CoA transferase [Dehalococcoidia bacterium]MCS5650135.1 CoA transferase [Dehalococcoidia bacterium]MEC7912748.1 CoA transferase [Chloroflexota bacterium]HAT21590.1 CoA transferase [Dehalococcoidia bacterium]HBF00330.1 CoA transferase [Dehalococcoidia bacterium]|tara:strand:- start:1409 stop:2620 length:1212 start_codon:yes stop_codon:yes gene_type:complete
MNNTEGALSGVRVVTCSTAQAGTVPYMLMADLGAEVIKVEVPGTGDGSRRAGEIKNGVSSFFETNNRGVKSLTLNLKAPEGKQILYELIKRADVFGQNFRPGAAERNGFGYEELRKINPKLVYASISAYGLEGPDANLPGTDAVGQALSGVTEAFSIPGKPMRTGVASVADETTAILTFGGILAALIHARETGQGQKVDTSLVGSAFRLMGWTMATTMWKNQAPITGARINGSRNRAGIAACFNDIDGKPLAIQLDARQWLPALKILGFHNEMDKKGLLDLGIAFDSEEDKNEILDTLSTMFSKDTREHWVSILREADMVAAPVNTMLEASNDPNVVANGYVKEIFHPKIGENIKIHGSPWKFSETPSTPGFAPELGEHNDEILSSLGYTDSQIEELQKNEAI